MGTGSLPAQKDNAIKIWDTISFRCMVTITGHTKFCSNHSLVGGAYERSGRRTTQVTLGGYRLTHRSYQIYFFEIRHLPKSLALRHLRIRLRRARLIVTSLQARLQGSSRRVVLAPGTSQLYASMPTPDTSYATDRYEMVPPTYHQPSGDGEPSAAAQHAHVSPTTPEAVQEMARKLAQLEDENRRLKGIPQTSAPVKSQVLHIIMRQRFDIRRQAILDDPEGGAVELKGHSPIPDLEGYRIARLISVSSSGGTTMSITRRWPLKKAKTEKTALPEPEPFQEHIRLISSEMIEAMESFCQSLPNFSENFPDWSPDNIPAPFLFWYHHRDIEAVEALEESKRHLVKSLIMWIEKNYGDLYGKVKEQFSQGVVSSLTMPFLVQPQDVLVAHQGLTAQGYTSSSWARKVDSRVVMKEKPSPRDKKETVETWLVKSWC